MKQRLIAYLLACLTAGILFATFNAITPDGDYSPIRIRSYPTADVDKAIVKINDLHLEGVSAFKMEFNKNLSWFCLQTICMTLATIVGTSMTLIVYTTICRSFKISFKK